MFPSCAGLTTFSSPADTGHEVQKQRCWLVGTGFAVPSVFASAIRARSFNDRPVTAAEDVVFSLSVMKTPPFCSGNPGSHSPFSVWSGALPFVYK